MGYKGGHAPGRRTDIVNVQRNKQCILYTLVIVIAGYASCRAETGN